MHTVRQLHIDGFWGSHSVSVTFDKGVNFIIGKNGSGKTTFINTLAATIKLDLEALERLTFSSIQLELQDSETRSIAELQIKKAATLLTLQSTMNIRFRRRKSDSWAELDLSEFYQLRRRYRSLNTTRKPAAYDQLEIGKTLHELVKLTWLSVHRATLARRYEDPEGTESTVDRKVAEIVGNFGSFLSSLDTQAARETKNFQEYIFLSLLNNPENSKSPWDKSLQFNIGTERAALATIFRQFGMSDKVFKGKLDRHFVSVGTAVNNRSKTESKGLSLEDLVAILDMQRIQKVVTEWQSTQNRISRIYEPKDRFQDIISSLLSNKRILIDERNRPIIETKEKERFGPEILSSGEKQLFILLSEAVLQERMPHVFIADEPELSLHVEWQSSLVGNLMHLNPNVQIIFATHSPDIVSSFGNKVIRIEEKIQ